MIEHQKEFEKYLKEERSLTDGSISSYLTYIREMPKRLGINVSPENLRQVNVENIILELKDLNVDWSNTQSALRAYAKFSDKYYPDTCHPDEVDEKSKEYLEGKVHQVYVNSYERNTEARYECIKKYGAVCKVCDINFEEIYGARGAGFIHVHHRTRLADRREEYSVCPESDLIPVCPNCHAMIHKRPEMSPEDLRELVFKIASNKAQNKGTS